MPLYWTIDSKERVFTGSGEGDVTFADAMALLDALAGAGALPYRKLFDGRAVQSAMTGDNLLAMAPKIRAFHEEGRVGALAIVAPMNNSARLPACWVHSRQPIGQ